MSKVDRLINIFKPFAALFWALGIVQKACPYMVIVGSILNEDVLPPPPLPILFI